MHEPRPFDAHDDQERSEISAIPSELPEYHVARRAQKEGADAIQLGHGELTRAAPDGHTFILTPLSALVIAPQMNDLPYKTPDDYDPFINLVAYYPLIAVRSESKYKTIQELLTDAKDSPGLPPGSSDGTWRTASGTCSRYRRARPPAVVRYLHDAAKAAIEDPKFVETMNARGIDVDYRPGDALRADLWREYKLHTPILKRTGMLKK